jgi:hypothetical protein
MTREHLIEDIQNVIELARTRSAGEDAERLRRAFTGLSRHVEGESEVPERVRGCLAESIRVLDRAGPAVDEDTWEYARACLDAALEYARSSPANV